MTAMTAAAGGASYGLRAWLGVAAVLLLGGIVLGLSGLRGGVVGVAGVFIFSLVPGVIAAWLGWRRGERAQWAAGAGIPEARALQVLSWAGAALYALSWAVVLAIAAWNLRGFAGDVTDQIREHYPELLRGYRTTIILTLFSFALATALGAAVALLRTTEVWVLRFVSGLYVEFFRNTPLLVQLYFWFFALPKLPSLDTHLPLIGTIDWLLSPMQAALLGLTLYTGAYTTEALRSGLLSIDKGQAEASRSLGLSYLQTRVYVVIPQAFRVAVPLLTSIFSALFRNSALVAAIGVTELLQAADNIQQDNFQTFELFTVAGVLYLTLTLPLAWASARLEKRVARSR
ncbi:MAG: amino acid ABC transporter permease [Tepidiformaceae bacterium]